MDGSTTVEIAVGDILRHIKKAVKVDQPKTFWSSLGPREIPF